MSPLSYRNLLILEFELRFVAEAQHIPNSSNSNSATNAAGLATVTKLINRGFDVNEL